MMWRERKTNQNLDHLEKLMQLGFEKDKFGALFAKGCSVTLHQEAGTWAFDISLPSGSAIGCEVALEDIEVNDDKS